MAAAAGAGAEAMALGAAGAADKKERYVRLQAEQLQIPGMYVFYEGCSSLPFSNPRFIDGGRYTPTIHTVVIEKV